MIKENNNIHILCKGGGSIISLPPVFSTDAEHLFVAKTNNIIGYNVLTGNRMMEFSRVNSQIIGFNIGLINDSDHVIACTKNGCIVFWKCNTGLKLREIKTGLTHIVFFKTFTTLDEDNNHILKALIGCENKTKKKYRFGILNLKTESLDSVDLQIEMGAKIHLDLAENGKLVAVVQEGVLYCYQIEANILRRHFIQGRVFTYVVCHPTHEIVLTGDNTGRAVIWENLLNKFATQAVYHWHTLPLRSACFSKSGTQFYTGGSECVLVKWMPNDNYKSFLPRLSGCIEHISIAVGNLYIALATRDNGIQIVTPHMKIRNSIQHLIVGNCITTDMVYDSRSKSLVFNSIPGQVQFFSPRNLELVYSLDVVGQNKYTDERETTIVNSSVSHIAIDKTGFWMATVEERMDSNIFESRLKFWFYDVIKQSFSLNTSVEYPHEGSITKLLFQPSNNENELCCVTIGNDKKLKIWQVVPIKTVYRDGLIWESASDISYRNLCPNTPSFSCDGSLLAIGFDSIVTAWAPNTCELKCSLRHPLQEDNLCHISFGADSQCHLLVSATKRTISVWNLLTFSIVWTVPIDVQCIVSDIASSYKVVFTADRKMYVFEPNSAVPVYIMKNMKSIPDIHSATFVPKKTVASDVHSNWAQRLSIYILTSKFELFAIESTASEITENHLHIKEDSSLFKDMVPEIRSVLLKEQNQFCTYTKDIRGKKFQQLLLTPVPSVQLSLVCEDILGDSLLQKEPTDSTVHMTTRENIEKMDGNVTNMLFDKQTHLNTVSKEKMCWISELL